MPGIAHYFRLMQEMGASDLHLASGVPPIVRVHGTLERLPQQELSAAEVVSMIREILTDTEIRRVQDEKNLDFALAFGTPEEGGPWRFRGNAYFQKNGPNLVLRGIGSSVPTLEELGLPTDLARLVGYHQGLVLTTGQAGSGKTATLAALIDIVNSSKPVHIITVEDPIEVLFESKRSMIEQREVGTHVENFHVALRGALRQDPDIIFVGEIRDPETAAMTLRAAQVGALVLATLHTRSAIETVSRFLSFFDDNLRVSARHQLTDVIRGIMCQRLIPRRSGTGRVVAAEVLISNSAVKHIIRDDRTHLLHSLMEIAASSGMTTMEESLLTRYHEGHIDLQTAFDNCNDKQAFISALPPELQKEVQMDWEVEIEIKRLEQLRETQKRQVQTRTL